MTPFIKLAPKLTVSWDINSITNKILDNVQSPLKNECAVYFDPTGNTHWQNFEKDGTPYISFARNFSKNFPDECTEVANKLTEIQQLYAYIPTDNHMMLAFINHEITPLRVNFVRTFGGISIPAHSDSTRDITINIGLQNSNLHVIKFSETLEFNNMMEASQLYDSPTVDYVMNDGDVYLLNTKKGHCVEALTTVPEIRYLITYTIK